MMYNLIFDIGANRGEYIEYLLKNNQSVKIVAVEPNNRLYNLINFKNYTGVTVLNYAVSNKKEKISFYECIEDDSVSTVSQAFIEKSCFTSSEKIMGDGRTFKDHYHYKDPVEVDTITLDDLILDYGVPDLIKIDVEGYELEVIQSLTKKVNKITFEWQEELIDRVVETANYLYSIGYRYFYTEIWYTSKDYHDDEPSENSYMDKNNFIDFLTKKINEPNFENSVSRTGMIWVK